MKPITGKNLLKTAGVIISNGHDLSNNTLETYITNCDSIDLEGQRENNTTKALKQGYLHAKQILEQRRTQTL